ncbi:hypothetical protein T265_15747, partial [Opisthorchis viverrini]
MERRRVGSSGHFSVALTKVVQQSAWTQHIAAARCRADQLPPILELAITNETRFVDQGYPGLMGEKGEKGDIGCYGD